MRCSRYIVIALALLLSSCSKSSAPAQTELPVIAKLPDFSFQDQNNVEFSPRTMAGKLWVVDFIFTRCPSFCPRLTGDLKSVQAKFPQDGSKVGFLSITVDPEFDTSQVLKAYMTRMQLDESNWHFVTGHINAVKQTVVGGFRVAMGESAPGVADIVHANHFVLVDAQQQIRGYYPSDPPGMERLVRDMRQLLGN